METRARGWTRGGDADEMMDERAGRGQLGSGLPTIRLVQPGTFMVYRPAAAADTMAKIFPDTSVRVVRLFARLIAVFMIHFTGTKYMMPMRSMPSLFSRASGSRHSGSRWLHTTSSLATRVHSCPSLRSVQPYRCS
ncbi:hypothetical protein PAXINDRAFT_169940, partial [Paxillus involutus ATCC 200175]